MLKTAVFYDPVFLKHDTGDHPESSERLRAVIPALKSAPFADRLEWISPDPASIEQLEAVHDPEYIRFVEERCLSGEKSMDADTIICPDSWMAAITSAGALVEAVGCVMDKSHANAFCAVRPPGHHAESNRAMGFCLFNNVAIGVRHAQKTYGARKTAIIDFDVHHGNGTQNAFYDDPSVFFVSLHQAHHYPGTGMEPERGGAGAEGTNMNIPM
ncbi:Acetylspermidine deacetylase; Deacetylases, including yeast histone deacetylase and acetoin utilization protein, partial [hydrothermal vent metagenome]